MRARVLFKSIMLLGVIHLLSGCATMEYYNFLEPKRSTNAQFIDMPYIYSGYSVAHQTDNNQYQFSGVLLDSNDKYLDIKKEHDFITLSNTENKLEAKEPALLVINPRHPFYLNEIKNNPAVFFHKHYLKSQQLPEFTSNHCPQILILNIDIYAEQPTTLEFGHCSNEDKRYVWKSIQQGFIQNNVNHNKPFGYQLGYLGFLITLPLDLVITPVYTLGWGIASSKNLLFSVGDE